LHQPLPPAAEKSVCLIFQLAFLQKHTIPQSKQASLSCDTLAAIAASDMNLKQSLEANFLAQIARPIAGPFGHQYSPFISTYTIDYLMSHQQQQQQQLQQQHHHQHNSNNQQQQLQSSSNHQGNDIIDKERSGCETPATKTTTTGCRSQSGR
jgi:hypothetical protein